MISQAPLFLRMCGGNGICKEEIFPFPGAHVNFVETLLMSIEASLVKTVEHVLFALLLSRLEKMGISQRV